MKHIDDPELGSLTLFDGTGFWERDFVFPEVGQCRLAIESEPSLVSGSIDWQQPTPNQRQAFYLLSSNLSEIVEKCAVVLAQSYACHSEVSSVKVLTDTSLWKLVSSITILLPTEFCDFSIAFSIAWEPEHGHTVFFKDSQVILTE